MKRKLLRALSAALGCCIVAACGQTGVRPRAMSEATNLPRPSRLLIYDFAVSESEVKEYQGIMRQQPTIKDAAERQRILARDVQQAVVAELINGLQGLGFTVERVSRGAFPTENDLLIDGQFIDVNEGNRLHRMVLGFGSGASRVDTQVQVYQGEERRKLIAFETHSDSGQLPGAAPMMGAGAVAQGGVTAGAVVANAAVTGTKIYKSDVERMSANSADQVVRYLSEFFAKQGWIRADQVRKARVVY